MMHGNHGILIAYIRTVIMVMWDAERSGADPVTFHPRSTPATKERGNAFPRSTPVPPPWNAPLFLQCRLSVCVSGLRCGNGPGRLPRAYLPATWQLWCAAPRRFGFLYWDSAILLTRLSARPAHHGTTLPSLHQPSPSGCVALAHQAPGRRNGPNHRLRSS
jgi:hypothetical protein